MDGGSVRVFVEISFAGDIRQYHQRRHQPV
jgi:hypothetical protein